MARHESITCDGCGKQKQENRWFAAVIFQPSHTHQSIVCLMAIDDVQEFLGKMNPADRRNHLILDLCGEECVLKKVSELIGGKT